jgi:hypothetical protein
MPDERPATPDEPIRVLRLLRELHRRGYERLRLHCGWSPNGMAWRYAIAPLRDFEPDGVHLLPERYPGRAFKSTVGEGAPFDLAGMEEAATDALADAFLARFRSVAAGGRGRDTAYAAWFEELLAACEPDGIPVMIADHFDARDGGIRIVGRDRPFPLPPDRPHR